MDIYHIMKLSRPLSIFILAYFLPFITNVYSYDTRFVPEFRENTLYLNIALAEGYKIYWKDPGDIGLPTSINLDQSENLKNYEVIWPEPIKETLDGHSSFIYKNKVSIPVKLAAIEPNTPVTLKGEIKYAICKDLCIPVSQDILVPNILVENSATLDNLYNILLAAIIGGVILNLMPCVLPVLLLKIFSVLNNRDNYRDHLICSILGIFFTFLNLGILAFALRSIGIEFGMGANFQQPIFVIILSAIMTIFTSNLLGKFEIKLPNAISYNLSDLQFTNSYINSFFTGIISAIFATPCTAPFLGTAIAFSMTASFAETMAIFVGISFGFSLPYIILIIYPPILNLLPKPGQWMITFKKILAFGMVATIFWLLSIIYNQLGIRSAIEVFLLLILVKFVAEKKMHSLFKILLMASLFCSLIFLPKISSIEDHKKEVAAGKLWENFSPDLIEKYLNQGKIVVVDITADWCVTCKYNKFMVWDRDNIIKILSNPKIVTLRADITNYTNETQNFMQSIGVYGIPFDVIYNPVSKKGEILPTILSQKDLEKALKDAGL